MTKELSKQLCELCGIKPKIKCHPWECLHVGYYKRDKCIINFKPDEECVKRRDLSGYVSYPDFGKPENFVRLVNLIYTCGINQPFDYQLATLSAEEDEDYSDYEVSETFEQRYLQVLLYTLAKNYTHWDELFFSLVTKSIRETQWLYD